MRDLQYGAAWGCFGFAFGLLTDLPAWKSVLVVVAAAVGFAVLLDYAIWRVRGDQ